MQDHRPARSGRIVATELLRVALFLLPALTVSVAGPVFALDGTADWQFEANQVNAVIGEASSTGDVNGDGFSDALVGAPYFTNGQANEGVVFVFMGSAAGLAAAPCCTLEVNLAGAHLGAAVSAGDVNGDGYDDVLVGAWGYANPDVQEGAAFLYLGAAAGLTTTPAWSIEGNQVLANLGVSVAIAGDITGDDRADAVIGTSGWDNGQSNEGRFQVYLGVPGGLAIFPALTVEGNTASRHLGGSVAGAGDVNGDGRADVLVGAPLDASGPLNEQGRAYLYLASGVVLAGAPALTFTGTEVSERLGTLSTAGDVDGDGYCDYLIGSPRKGAGNEGEANLYAGAAAPTAVPAWTFVGPGASGNTGESLSTAGDVNGDGYADVIVGSPFYDTGAADRGRIDVFYGAPGGLWGFSSLTVLGVNSNDRLGKSAGTAGDVNGDGYSDLLVGATWYSNGQAQEGTAYLYLGGGDNLSTFTWSEQSNVAAARLGQSVALGDVNGDGLDDVIVGAYTWTNGQNSEGRAQVFAGGLSIPSGTPLWEYEINQAFAHFGYRVANAGDVNGDGFTDVLVTAEQYSNGQANEGAAFVFHGSATGPSPAPDWSVESNLAQAFLGSGAGGAGDVNGDGYSDVIIGASGYGNGEANEGQARVYLGGPGGLSTTPAWSFESNQASAYLGAVGTAGDVNADGFSDVIVGALNYANPPSENGRAWVFTGSSAGLSTTPFWFDGGRAAFGAAVSTAGDYNGDGYSDVIVGDPGYNICYLFLGGDAALTFKGTTAAVSGAGRSVACAGDLNGDGLSDFVVGNPTYTNGQANEGAIQVAYGSTSGFVGVPVTQIESGFANAQYGTSVAGGGDINGDGFSDLLVGAPTYTSGQANEGIAFMYNGNYRAGVDRRIQQARLDDTALIGPLGNSEDASDLRVRLRIRSPEGRGRLTVEWQAVSVQALFKNAAIQTDGVAHDTGAPGVTGSVTNLSTVIGDGQPGTPLHWQVRYASRNPLFPRSRWLSPAWNAPNETDLRLAGAWSAVGDAPPVPAGGVLRAWPNPFHQSTHIALTLPTAAEASVSVFDLSGRRVARLEAGRLAAGEHVWTWDGNNEQGRPAPTGVYFVRAIGGHVKAAGRVVLMR